MCIRDRGGDGSEDLCLCYATFPGTRKPTVMCKAYDGVWGAYQMVGTRYKSMWDGDRFRPNCGMFAERIFGVIDVYKRQVEHRLYHINWTAPAGIKPCAL